VFSSPFICSVARSPLQRLSLERVSPLQRLSLERISPLYLCQCQYSGEVGNENVWWNKSYGLISNISITISCFLKQQTHITFKFLVLWGWREVLLKPARRVVERGRLHALMGEGWVKGGLPGPYHTLPCFPFSVHVNGWSSGKQLGVLISSAGVRISAMSKYNYIYKIF
jgi:hypothetical protein